MGDEDLAAAIAELAGSILVDFSRTGLWSGMARGRFAETAVNKIILGALKAHRPADPVLSGEGDGGPSASRERCWLIDPLDGTREYCEGRDDWAVQVALAEAGKRPIGAVFLPARNVLLRSDRPPAIPTASGTIRILVSRTGPAAAATDLARLLGATVVPMGSVGAKVAALLTGEAQVYVHSGGQSQWDSCAPVAISLAAGFDATRLNGDPFNYGSTDVSLPDLLITHPAVTPQVREELARLDPSETDRERANAL